MPKSIHPFTKRAISLPSSVIRRFINWVFKLSVGTDVVRLYIKHFLLKMIFKKDISTETLSRDLPIYLVVDIKSNLLFDCSRPVITTDQSALFEKLYLAEVFL